MSSHQDILVNLAALRAGEAHVWLSFHETAPVAEKFFLKLLPDAERERAEKISPAGVRGEFVLAHALVRAVLSQYHPIAPGAWQFERGPHGKPFISAPGDAPPLQFNLTHTRGLAACVVALDAAAGVDAEYLEPHADLPAVAREFLAPAAAWELENLSGEKQTLRFYEHWTRQEACNKASGVGLASPPRAGGNADGWRFLQQQVSPRHILAAAVCGGQGIFRLRTVGWQLRGDELRLEACEPFRHWLDNHGAGSASNLVTTFSTFCGCKPMLRTMPLRSTTA